MGDGLKETFWQPHENNMLTYIWFNIYREIEEKLQVVMKQDIVLML